MARNYITLNNYNYSDESINEVKNFLLNNIYPERIDTNYKKKIYASKWRPFVINDDKLFYRPLRLYVIPDGDKQRILKEMYDNYMNAPKADCYITVCLWFLQTLKCDTRLNL